MPSYSAMTSAQFSYSKLTNVNTYAFRLALRFWHPSVDAESISSAIGREADVSARAGDQRATPLGQPLKGTHPTNYWQKGIVQIEDSSELGAETAIANLLAELLPVADFLVGMRAGGGKGVLEIDSWADHPYAIQLTPEILREASRMGLEISHHVFKTRQYY